jgi:hypothetical protein
MTTQARTAGKTAAEMEFLLTKHPRNGLVRPSIGKGLAFISHAAGCDSRCEHTQLPWFSVSFHNYNHIRDILFRQRKALL